MKELFSFLAHGANDPSVQSMVQKWISKITEQVQQYLTTKSKDLQKPLDLNKISKIGF